MTGAIVVREAMAEECAAIDELLATVYGGKGHVGGGERVSEDTAARAAHACVLVAIDSTHGDLLGSATIVTEPGPASRISGPGEAEVRQVAVAVHARGRGAGTALTQACIDRARKAGCTRVVLATLPSLTDAQRLYERLGFVRAPSRDPVGPLGRMCLYELPL